MDNDTIDEDRRKRRMLGLGIIIALVIVLALLYFLWGFINKGTLMVTADAPFTVEIFGGEKFTCDTSPCEISDRRGIKDLIITKDGYKSILTEAELKLWRTTELEITFQIVPTISKAGSLPEQTDKIEYELVLDKKNHMQKLIDANDENERAIVYFQKSLKNPKIFGSKKYALIVDEDVYKIDIRLKERGKVTDPNLTNIDDGKWSDDGRYFVFSKADSTYLWVLDAKTGTAKQLLLTTSIPQVAWIYDNGLIFVTRQTYKSEGAGKYGSDYMDPLEELSATGFTFGTYHPEEDSYTRIETFSEISEIPAKLIPTSNGKTIYFQSAGENFKIEL